MKKIYTGGGDGGTTGLFSGERVSKSHLRVHAYGELDELNSLLGVLVAKVPGDEVALTRDIREIQGQLMDLSAHLAATPGSRAETRLESLSETRIKALEERIDQMEARLPALKGFILPGGHLSASLAHFARTVCRRVERGIVALAEGVDEGESPSVSPHALAYLNRLSDYLFVLARHLNHLQGADDVLWK